MNPSDLLLIGFLFLVGVIFGFIASVFTGVFNHFLINRFLTESILRNGINVFLISISSFLGSMFGFIRVIGFAADENAGEIFPYYFGISILVSILCSIGYYLIRIR